MKLSHDKCGLNFIMDSFLYRNLIPLPMTCTKKPKSVCIISYFEETNSNEYIIPDLGEVSSPINIDLETGGLIKRMRVKINIEHTYVRDLIIFLVAPDNSEIRLANRIDDDSDDFFNTVFSDFALVSIQTATSADAPFTGEWIPDQPLSTFNGKNLNGVWNLKVQDDTGTDIGKILNWSIYITYCFQGK
jgi:subtilisin-like proprotein convertase family protein